jgi:hypothetical protein
MIIQLTENTGQIHFFYCENIESAARLIVQFEKSQLGLAEVVTAIPIN